MAKQNKIHTIKKHANRFILPYVWFIVGFLFAASFLLGIVATYFRYAYEGKVIPGVYIDNMYVGDKTEEELRAIYDDRNKKIQENSFIFKYDDETATISAKALEIGYDTNMIATQALGLGKSNDIFSNLYILANSYFNGTTLNSTYKYNMQNFKAVLDPLEKKIYKEPIDAQFALENNRVVAFSESQDGQTINYDEIKKNIEAQIPMIITSGQSRMIAMDVPIAVLKPQVTTEEANNLGIVEQIGSGKSYFVGSIPNRMYNINLAASRVNGVLVAPGDEFSFNKSIGDVSKYTGYKEAYVIQAGRTVLGDGGGVCQVSSTLFRAVLNAGLPISERHGHAYRVGYYEQQSAPGFDATIYVPTVDFKFKNDTDTHILVQSYYDANEASLTFTLYGKKDNRVVKITEPVITNRAPAPEPLYQDDPNLPKGTEKQVDYAAAGATVTFNRTVEKDGKVLISEDYTTRYRPWQAVFLRGTKEG